jgi:hypothetical protein
MKAARQFDSRGHAEKALAMLRKHGISAQITKMSADGSDFYAGFVESTSGRYLVLVEDKHWEEAMRLMLDGQQ